MKSLNISAKCRRICLLLISWAMLHVNQVLAVEVLDLYQSKVIINNQSNEVRITAQRDAFRQVLVKVSGNAKVLNNREVKDAVNDAAKYLVQFQFIRNEDNELLLDASFDEGKVNRLLRQESLPIWGKRRPSILLWMAGEDQQSHMRQIVSKEAYPQIRSQLLNLSNGRGLPLLFPLFDLNDSESIGVSDVWGYFFDYINEHSRRYNTDAIVVSRFWYKDGSEFIEPTEGSATDTGLSTTTLAPLMPLVVNNYQPEGPWHLQWRLYEDGKQSYVEQRSGELNDLIQLLVDHTADHFAQAYAVDATNLTGATRVTLTVKNVSELRHLIQAEKLLNSFSVVADVMLKTVNGDVAEFEVALIGELFDLLQGIGLEQHFEKIYDPLAEQSQQQPLAFRWRP